MKKKHLSAFALPAVGLAACLTLGTLGCAHDHDHSEEAEEESWAVTAWGEEFEIFAETGLLGVVVVMGTTGRPGGQTSDKQGKN